MKIYDSLLRVNYALCTDDEYACIHTVEGTEMLQDLKSVIQGNELVIALDQATVKTGVCILDYLSKEVLAVLDLENRGFPTKQLYFQSIYDFIKSNFGGEHIRYFFYEIPVEHSKNTRTLAVLEAMRAFIADFTKRMPELKNADVLEVYSTNWKSHFLKAPEYNGKRKNRADVKESARREACKRAPKIQRYFLRVSEPPDSCDAVGIAYGALEEIYGSDKNDIRRPNKTMPIKNIKFSMHIAPLSDNELSPYLHEHFGPYCSTKRIEVLNFNSDMTPEENCKRYCGACPGTLGIMPVVDTKVSQELKWETGKELREGQLYYVFCWR